MHLKIMFLPRLVVTAEGKPETSESEQIKTVFQNDQGKKDIDIYWIADDGGEHREVTRDKPSTSAALHVSTCASPHIIRADAAGALPDHQEEALEQVQGQGLHRGRWTKRGGTSERVGGS